MPGKRIAIAVLTGLLVSFSVQVLAKSLGTAGKTYPIIERDMKEYLKEKSAQFDTEALKDTYKKSVERKLRQGPQLNLPVATVDRTFYVDPSIEMDQDILDDKGNILIPKGTRANPADRVTLTKAYLFIDARADKQVKFALQYVASRPGMVSVIITDGDILKLMDEYGFAYRQIYHANPHLIERFAIERTPSILTQKGKLLRIDEKAL
ncbi:MAG: hypothetical protein A2X93_07815 [Deltaproteobacteria bacterium GWC2_56_8]|nr:MAG: hypothetical protein A2X93_07815 [Deltaproteobacteria bacterium GWC2_56_8]